MTNVPIPVTKNSHPLIQKSIDPKLKKESNGLDNKKELNTILRNIKNNPK
ncbi:hypothetical protein HYX12_03020 [Candidatus Woesearchaeota archaeon]|nr:hypothetical protein [Candidatus Woesearchaeota archaeon]